MTEYKYNLVFNKLKLCFYRTLEQLLGRTPGRALWSLAFACPIEAQRLSHKAKAACNALRDHILAAEWRYPLFLESRETNKFHNIQLMVLSVGMLHKISVMYFNTAIFIPCNARFGTTTEVTSLGPPPRDRVMFFLSQNRLPTAKFYPQTFRSQV